MSCLETNCNSRTDFHSSSIFLSYSFMLCMQDKRLIAINKTSEFKSCLDYFKVISRFSFWWHLLLKIKRKKKEGKKPQNTPPKIPTNQTKNPIPQTNEQRRRRRRKTTCWQIQMPTPKIAVCFVLGVFLEGAVSILFQKWKTFCAHTLQDTCASHIL